MHEDDEKTVFLPATMASKAPSLQLETPPGRDLGSFQGASVPPLQGIHVEYRSGINPLMEMATELFFIHYHIVKGRFQEVAQLRAFIQDAFIKFELRAQQAHLSKALIKSSKYVLATFLDETIMQSVGGESGWGQNTLLSQFFNETWGGATVFKIRQFCIENIQEYIDLLEMLYVCLCLGFKGQYGNMQDGEAKLERLKRETYQLMVGFRGDRSNAPLSPHGASRVEGKISVKKRGFFISLLVSCLSVLFVSYISMSIYISHESKLAAHSLPGLSA